ncbi:MAG: site-specific integrase [Pseudomonadota bacterium]|nr:site-specific integrase [Pseudomonadota bacterium]
MKPTDFALRLTAFLTDYLPGQRNLSQHTIRSYRDSFTLLLRFARDERGIAPERLCIEDLTAPVVLDFLAHLQRERHCSPRTCNQRLGALHSFFRYLQTEEPERLAQCQRILAIPQRRFARAAVRYLSTEELGAILAQPDFTHLEGRRDAVLLTLLYDTGVRCQELIDLSVRDVRLESPALVRITGKGRKTRVVPLMTNTAQLLREYLAEMGLSDPEHIDAPLFGGRYGGRLSRSGVRYILEKYIAKARTERPDLPQHIGPHTLRHAKAMHLLQSGNPLTVIRDILGHTDIKSTEVYARADIGMKKRALERAVDASMFTSRPSWQADENLMNWLRSL